MGRKKKVINPTATVWNFSGGRTSALMTIRGYKPGDLVIFCDTGREHGKTYKFIHDFEAHEGIPVMWVSRIGGFRRLITDQKMVPNRVMRFCTNHLKIMMMREYLLANGITEWHNNVGFRADEQRRIKKYKSRWVGCVTHFPLNDAGIDKPQVLDYWSKKPYDLEIPHILGNCDLCFMKGKNAIIAILREFPELADKWIEDEKIVGGTYLNGISMEQMRNIAQNNLFKKQYDLKQIAPAFDCACTA